MNIYRINTTAYEEEDFFLMTTLTAKQIESVISPIIKIERAGDEDYDNDSLVRALRNAFPKHTIHHYSDFETISI